MKKTIEVLFGDDQLDVLTLNVFKNGHLLNLTNQVPNIAFNWTYKLDHTKTIEEARTGKYDVVVTDMQYTPNGKQGLEVIDIVSKLSPKPLLILCSNCDLKEEGISLDNSAVDYVAGVGGNFFHKFDSLIHILTEHFKQGRGYKLK